MTEVSRMDAEAIAKEQEGEIAKVDDLVRSLRLELKRCPATIKGYREAAEIRSSIAMWDDMRQRMLAVRDVLRGK